MKFKKTKWIQIRVSTQNHDVLSKAAKSEGRTIAGMIRYALKKVFNIELE